MPSARIPLAGVGDVILQLIIRQKGGPRPFRRGVSIVFVQGQTIVSFGQCASV